MKKIIVLVLLFPLSFTAQEAPASLQFWNHLKSYCGKAYSGTITAGGTEGDGFTGEKLVMHLRDCGEEVIRIPFFVDEDKSRTWVLTLGEDKRISLSHDHRNRDGSEEKITRYGGISPNEGLPSIQFFPADPLTANLIPAAATNVWWFTLEDNSFTYNLRRIGSDRVFSVNFNLLEEVETPAAPWDSEN